jgi:hypothetical protein
MDAGPHDHHDHTEGHDHDDVVDDHHDVGDFGDLVVDHDDLDDGASGRPGRRRLR